MEKHNLTVTGASTFERTNGEWNRAEAKTFPNDLLQNENLQSAEQIMPVVGSRFQSTLISFWEESTIPLMISTCFPFLTARMDPASLDVITSGLASLLQVLPGSCTKSHS